MHICMQNQETRSWEGKVPGFEERRLGAHSVPVGCSEPTGDRSTRDRRPEHPQRQRRRSSWSGDGGVYQIDRNVVTGEVATTPPSPREDESTTGCTGAPARAL